jgi:hypothetical protein
MVGSDNQSTQEVPDRSTKGAKEVPQQEFSNGHEVESQVEQSVDGQSEAPEEVANGHTNGKEQADEAEDEAESVMPIGSVNQDQDVINDDNVVIGRVNGESVAAGSLVSLSAFSLNDALITDSGRPRRRRFDI